MTVLADLRYSIRSLARAPGLAATLLLSIAIGIGCNAVVLGFIKGVTSRNLPALDTDRLVSIFARDTRNVYGPISYDDLQSLKRSPGVFESLGAIRYSVAAIAIGGHTSMMSVAETTPGFLHALSPSSSLPARSGAVISQRVWRDGLGSRARILDQPIGIDGRQQVVTGVAPEWLDGLYMGRDIDIWASSDVPSPSPDDAGTDQSRPETTGRSYTWWAVGRLRSGITARTAEIEVNKSRSSANTVTVLRYTGIPPDLAGGISRIRVLLPAATGTVFVIACATVAGFLLSRSSGRAHETSVRVALGASRGQLGRQLLTDSVVISLGGGSLGVLLAVWTTHVIPALLFDQDAEKLVFSPSLGAILAAATVCAAILTVCGLAPLVEVRDDDPAAVLRRESGGLSNSARRVRAGLVIGQMACGCLLVIATGQLLDGFRSALRTATGNRIGRPIVAIVEAAARFGNERAGTAYFQSVEQAALKVPGISSVAWVAALPGSRPAWQQVRTELPTIVRRDVVMDVAVFPQEAVARLSRPLRAGRMFGWRDGPRSCRTIMINEQAAAQFFDGDAVGRSIEDPSGARVEIIGVIDMGPQKKTGSRARPAAFYYGGQTPPPFDEVGPQRFFIPSTSALDDSLRHPNAADRVGDPGFSRAPQAVLDANIMSANYFNEVGATPVAGRVFQSGLDPLECRVGLVNQEAAELYFGGDAVGGAIIDAAGNRTSIIGVMPSAMLRTSQRRPEPAVYYPIEQNYLPRMTMILGARGADASLVASVQRQVKGVAGGSPLHIPVVMTLDEYLSRTALASERISTMLMGTCAALAMALCLAGVYGAMTDSVRQRRREIAMRLALGAQGRRVIGQVLWDGLRLAAAGTCAGLAASVFVARFIAQVAPTSQTPAIWVWLSAPLILTAVLAVASVFPARRALKVDPLVVLRDS
jgi:putative ABC transport system permease protein